MQTLLIKEKDENITNILKKHNYCIINFLFLKY